MFFEGHFLRCGFFNLGARIANHKGSIFVFEEVIQEIGITQSQVDAALEVSEPYHVEIGYMVKEVGLEILVIFLWLDVCLVQG